MSFERFMKANKAEHPSIKYAVSADFTDENGKPLEWELKPLNTEENAKLRDSCMREIPVKGKGSKYKLDNGLYMAKIAAASVVFPDLHDRDLQDSYGVMTPEELITQMVSVPGEFDELLKKVYEISGFTTMEEDIEEAKN